MHSLPVEKAYHIMSLWRAEHVLLIITAFFSRPRMRQSNPGFQTAIYWGISYHLMHITRLQQDQWILKCMWIKQMPAHLRLIAKMLGASLHFCCQVWVTELCLSFWWVRFMIVQRETAGGDLTDYSDIIMVTTAVVRSSWIPPLWNVIVCSKEHEVHLHFESKCLSIF